MAIIKGPNLNEGLNRNMDTFPKKNVKISPVEADSDNLSSSLESRKGIYPEFATSENGTLTTSSSVISYFNVVPSTIFGDICSKSEYQKKTLKTIDDKSLEDMALLVNDEDPIVRKLAELRISAGR